MCKDKIRETSKSYGLGSLGYFNLVLILFELVAMECLKSEDYSFLIVFQGQDPSLLSHDFVDVAVTLKMLLN